MGLKDRMAGPSAAPRTTAPPASSAPAPSGGGKGFFQDMKNAQATNKLPVIIPGNYVLRINLCKGQQSSWKSKSYFVSEFEVVKSNVPERPVGSSVGWVLDMDNPNRKFQEGKVKQFISIATGIPENEIENSDAEDAISEDNPLAGKLIRCEAFLTKTQKNTDFTVVNWLPYENEA